MKKDTSPSKDEYPAAFEEFWENWLKTSRPRDPKRLAFKAWRNRLREGVKPEALLEAAKVYQGELRSNARTNFVMMGSTFLGPNERWVEYQPKGGDPPNDLRNVRNVLQRNARVSRTSVTTPEERIDGRPFLREILSKLAEGKGIEKQKPGS